MVNKKWKWLSLFLIGFYIVTFAVSSYPKGLQKACPEDGYYTARVKNISNKDYFPAVYEAIKDAKESIFMVMYLVSFNPEDEESPVFKLVSELVSAHKRGVRVMVILDHHRKSDRGESGVNYKVYVYLKETGIDVRFDNISTYSHNKVIVIDERMAVVGSANWSVAGLTESNETNVIIDCPQLALELIEDIRIIKLAPVFEKGRTADVVEEKNEYVSIPCKFVFNKEIFGRMGSTNDERSLDVYLVFLRVSGGEPGKDIPVSYRELALELGLTERMDRTAWRRQINKTLRKLADRYELIDLKIEFNKPFTARLKNLGGDCFRLPEGYWEWGWDRLLMMREKMCLLINLAELGREEGVKEWCMSRDSISKKYGICKRTIEKGMGGLNRYNIVGIEHSVIKDEDYGSRAPNVYQYKGLYDMAQFQNGLVSLEKIYGKKKVALARRYAGIVRRRYDLPAIEDIIRFMGVYGEDVVSRAFAEVAKKRPDNPYRTFRYTIGIMRQMAEDR